MGNAFSDVSLRYSPDNATHPGITQAASIKPGFSQVVRHFFYPGFASLLITLDHANFFRLEVVEHLRVVSRGYELPWVFLLRIAAQKIDKISEEKCIDSAIR